MLVNVLLLQQQLELVASLTAYAPYEFFRAMPGVLRGFGS